MIHVKEITMVYKPNFINNKMEKIQKTIDEMLIMKHLPIELRKKILKEHEKIVDRMLEQAEDEYENTLQPTFDFDQFLADNTDDEAPN